MPPTRQSARREDFQCPYCGRGLPTKAGLTQHLAKTRRCQARLQSEITARLNLTQMTWAEGMDTSPKDDNDLFAQEGMDEAEAYYSYLESWDNEIPPQTHPGHTSEDSSGSSNTQDALEEQEEIEIQNYTGEAGASIQPGSTNHHAWKHITGARYNTLNDGTWNTAHWLMTTKLTSTDRDEYFKIPENANCLPWKNNRSFLQAIDALPHGPDWKESEFTLTGDSGSETVSLWHRNILECTRNLIGNQSFKAHMRYTPERHWKRVEKDGPQVRVYGEMWTGEWWWRTQEYLEKKFGSVTVAPMLLSSDKTQLSVFSGDKKAWPVYLTLGNIAKSIRRQLSQHATVLIAYLPVAKLDCFTNIESRRTQHQELFHCCMTTVLKPTFDAGRNGVDMTCSDGRIRRVHPILAAYMADWPEQCLVAGCLESRCPICKAMTNERGEKIDPMPAIRSKQETLDAIKLKKSSGYSQTFTQLGLRPSVPFWANLHPVNMFTCFTPDTLHQLHKGVFGDHLVKWCKALLGEKELDRRYKRMPYHHGLRHFGNGISQVSQWTGREHKNMQKVFIGAIAGLPDSQAVRAARALLDFIYLAQFSVASEQVLEQMDNALALFHDLKGIFTEMGVCPNGFHGIPKIHMLFHYTLLIRELGTADGYSTEYSERLHIDYAKVGYRASNKVNATEQMVMFLQRRKAVKQHSSYLQRKQNSGIRINVAAEEEGQQEHEGETRTYVQTQDVARRASRYPSPTVRFAKRATLTQVTAQWIIQNHQTPELLTCINTFLSKRSAGKYSTLSTEERFDLWTRIKLAHASPPFSSPLDQPIVEVIRASAPRLDPRNGRVIKAGVFDTVLLLESPEKSGLHRYRAARVRAIFQLPRRLHAIYPGVLIYVEYFTTFGAPPRGVSGLYTMAQAKRNGKRDVGIRGIDEIRMACQLTPNWTHKDTLGALEASNDSVDLLSTATSFYFNTFSSVFMYGYGYHWKFE